MVQLYSIGSVFAREKIVISLMGLIEEESSTPPMILVFELYLFKTSAIAI